MNFMFNEQLDQMVRRKKQVDLIIRILLIVSSVILVVPYTTEKLAEYHMEENSPARLSFMNNHHHIELEEKIVYLDSTKVLQYQVIEIEKIIPSEFLRAINTIMFILGVALGLMKITWFLSYAIKDLYQLKIRELINLKLNL